jgi:putative transposase
LASALVRHLERARAIHVFPLIFQQPVNLEYIQPGNPQQNAYVERFNKTVRYEWLSQYYWSSLQEVQAFDTRWMWSYNHDRPNMALGGFTPKQKLAMAA